MKPSSGEFERVLGGLPFIEYSEPERFEWDLLEALKRDEIWEYARSKVLDAHTWQTRTKRILSDIAGEVVGGLRAPVRNVS